MTASEPQIRVLIAEDDDAAAQLIKTNLKRAGLEAAFVRARNGEEAIAILEGAAQERIPDSDRLVVLLDIRMPKADGLQVLKRMKSSQRLRKVPVVMLTTSDRPKEVELCYQLGCNLYLKKQVDYAKFTESIGRLAAFISCCELPLFGELPND